MYEAGKILHSLLQLRRYSAGRSNKLMNTEPEVYRFERYDNAWSDKQY